MKKTLTLTVALLLSITTYLLGNSGLIMLGFAGAFEGEPLPLDSILVQNMTKGWDTMLYAPDNYIILDIITGVHEDHLTSEKGFQVRQNIPNPFQQNTSIGVLLPEDGYLEMVIRNSSGQEVIRQGQIYEAGNHLFTFSSGNERVYILTATFNGVNRSVKMISSNTGGQGKSSGAVLKYAGYSGGDDPAAFHKTQTDGGYLPFSYGDLMRLTGFATTPTFVVGNNEIEDTPFENTAYVFNIVEGIRCTGNPSVTDIEGNVYNTVQVGEQCWLRENLKTTHYKNGTPINYPGTNNAAWQSDTTGAYAWYNNEILWKEIYGALYNWFAAVNLNGLCPEGWHVPTHDEWYELTDLIGGAQSPNGNKLKSCRQVNSSIGGGCSTAVHPRWNEHSIHYGTNDYGFSGLAGDGRKSTGAFINDDLGFFGSWWSSTPAYIPGNVWARALLYEHGQVSDGFQNKHSGYSIRCLRDE
jgi:uncharacterized protein (TIGR02145 family)